MKRYKIYSGFLDWFVTVEARNEEMAIVLGKQKMIERLQEDADMWAVEIEPSGQSRD